MAKAFPMIQAKVTRELGPSTCATAGKQKTRLTAVLLLVLTTSCGSAVLDYLTVFRIQGKIVEEDTSKPIVGAFVHFIDSGLDDHSESQPELIGRTDEHGRIVATLNYPWGVRRGSRRRQSPPSFQIRISAPGFAPTVQTFVLHELERFNDGTVIVPIDSMLSRDVELGSSHPGICSPRMAHRSPVPPATSTTLTANWSPVRTPEGSPPPGRWTSSTG